MESKQKLQEPENIRTHESNLEIQEAGEQERAKKTSGVKRQLSFRVFEISPDNLTLLTETSRELEESVYKMEIDWSSVESDYGVKSLRSIEKLEVTKDATFDLNPRDMEAKVLVSGKEGVRLNLFLGDEEPYDVWIRNNETVLVLLRESAQGNFVCLWVYLLDK